MPTASAKRKLRVVHAGTAACPDAAHSAARTLDLEREGLQALRATLDQELREPFRVAVATLAAAKGRVIVTGIGKSGHVGQKIAATFASTGTPAFFVHRERGEPRRPRHDHAARTQSSPSPGRARASSSAIS